jgi:hypothetical protein
MDKALINGRTENCTKEILRMVSLKGSARFITQTGK